MVKYNNHEIGAEPHMGSDFAKRFWDCRDANPVSYSLIMTGLNHSGLDEDQLADKANLKQEKDDNPEA